MRNGNTCGNLNYETGYSCCSPLVYKGDFDNTYTMTDIAARIISDRKFDERLKKMAMNNNKMEEIKNA